MTRKYIFTFFLLVAAIYSDGQAFQFLTDKFTQKLNSSSIVNNPNLSGANYNDVLPFTSHDRWQDAVNANGSPTFTFKSLQDYVRIGIRRDTGVVVPAYDYSVAVQIKCYNPVANFDINTAQPAATINAVIPVSWHPDSLSAYNDLSVYKFSGYQGFRVTITGIYNQTNPTVPLNRNTLGLNFYIESGVEAQRYDQAATHPNPYAYISDGNLFIDWSVAQNPKPVQYDLEWTYIDDYHLDISSGNKVPYFNSSSNVNYDFRKNSTRVRLNTTNYVLPVIYEHGAVAFRFRAVKPDPATGYKDVTYGAWSMPDYGVVSLTNTSAAVLIPQAFAQDSLNWQYTINFAEEGKYKNVITYFDGALKDRQTQTKINTDYNYTIAVDKVYDYEGRPSIQTLPTPMLQTSLRYRPDVTLNNTTGNPYTAADFDKGCIEPHPDALAPLKSNAAANVYYSPLNPDQNGMQKYVADAQGYPFVQTVYSPDNTNKVLLQGGAGLDHQLWNSHGTKYEYVRATQYEIDRLLGTEAGRYEFYPKQIVTDPNGQTSFSILNSGGKVVATGLAGNIDTSDKPINRLDNFVTGSNICSDMLLNLAQEKKDDRLVGENSFYVDNNSSQTTLKYSVAIQPFPTGCSNQYLNIPAVYTVRITNECGTPFMNQAGQTTADSGVTTSAAPVITSTTTPTQIWTSTPQVSGSLDKAKYLVKKELVFSAKNIKDQASQFIRTNEPVCYNDSNFFIRRSVENAKFPCIDSGATNMCDQRRKQMLSELWPGAKYGNYMKDADSNFYSGASNSIFTFSVQFNPLPANITTGSVTQTVSITRSYTTGQTSASTIIGCPNSVAGKCSCGTGAHTDDNYCCESCLRNHCECIKFTQITSTVTKVHHKALVCKITPPPPLTSFQLNQIIPNVTSNFGLSNTDVGSIRYYNNTTPSYYTGAFLTGGGTASCACNGAINHHNNVSLYRFYQIYNTSSPADSTLFLVTGAPHSCDSTWSEPPITTSFPLLASVGYRYQSPCITLAHPITINGVQYTSLADIIPQDLIDNFSDTIAEALLPLHPEYCQLLSCNDGPFDQQMDNLQTWQQAQVAHLFTLDNMITSDPMYINLDPYTQIQMYDKLAHFQGSISGKRLDQMALEMAYCGAGNGGEQAACASDLYSNEIANSIFINDNVKQKYFTILKQLYLGNRNFLKQQNLDAAGNVCGPCASNRMSLIGNPVFPAIFDANGNVNASTTGLPSWMAALYNSAANGTLTSTTIPSQIQDSLNTQQTNKVQYTIDNIISNLQNCDAYPSPQSAFNILRILLTNYMSSGGVLTPAVMKDKMQAAGLNLNDLCHPFLVAYGLLDTPPDQPATYACASNALYTDMAAFFNTTGAITAISGASAAGGTVTNIDLTTLGTNTFTNRIRQYYNTITGISPSQVSLQAFTQSTSTTVNGTTVTYPYIRVRVLPVGSSVGSADELSFYIKGHSEPAITGSVTTNLAGASSVSITQVMCLNNDLSAMNNGAIAANTAVLLAHVNGNAIVDTYYIWNNKIAIMQAVSESSLTKAVTCVDLKQAMIAFHNDQPAYFYSELSNHPLYEQALTNYLNVYFNKQYSFDDYYNLMNGCAITDQVMIRRSNYSLIAHVDNPTQYNTFINNLKSFTERQLVLYKFGYPGSPGVSDIVLDYNSIPQDSLYWYKVKISQAGASALYWFYDDLVKIYAKNDVNSTTPSLTSSAITAIPNTIVSLVFPFTEDENNIPVNYTGYVISLSGTMAQQGTALVALKSLATQYDAVLTADIESFRSSDYATPAKQDYLNYVYGLSGSHDDIIAAIDPAIVKTATPSLTNDFYNFTTLTYADPYCTGTKTDLYAYGPNNVTHPGYARLLFILSQIDPSQGLGNYNRIFPNVLFSYGGNNPVTPGGGGPNPPIAIAKKANGTYWYRYFDATNHLFNIYVTPPANSATPLQNYRIVNINTDVTATQGDDSAKTFNVVVSDGTNTITCRGYTDFPIGYSRKLQNVVLLRDNTAMSCIDTIDCERGQLITAIHDGQAAYQMYFDSLRNDMSKRMMNWVLNNSKDTLNICTNDEKYQYTLYYYDRAGNLTRTVPPAGVNVLSGTNLALVDPDRNSTTPAVNSTILTNHKKASIYQYNSLNQLVYQQTPDGGITYFFYDAAGRLVFSQNSKQRPSGKYSYTLYDDLSRVIETGEIAIGCMYTDNPNVLFDNTPCNFPDPAGGTVTSVHPPYVSKADLYPMSDIREYIRGQQRKDVVITTYDTAITDLGAVAGEMLSTQENLRKRVSSIFYYQSIGNTSSANIGQINWSNISQKPDFGTYYSYDMLGNVKTVTYSYQKLASLLQRYKRIDYDYDLLSGKVDMVSYNRGRPDQFYHKYLYDADNRITQVTTSNDGTIWNTDARYDYYKHGPLASVKVGDGMLQSLEYAYTIQGWLKAINGDVRNPQKEMGQNGLPGDLTYARDAIAHALDYFRNDYKPIGGATASVASLPQPSAAQNLWNGNIARQTTSITGLGSLQRSYRYDQLQRLKLASNATVDENALTVASPSDIYKSSYSYDPDGNILSLQRWNGSATGTNTVANLDNFTYSYTAGGTDNKLLQVADNAPAGSGTDLQPGQQANNYSYDKIGNLVKDVQGKISIDWNVYGKIKTITDVTSTPNKTINFDYDGAGNRVFKEVVIKNSATNEDHKGEYYVHDAQGNILSVYKMHSIYSPVQVMQSINSSIKSQAGIASMAQFVSDNISPLAGFSGNLITQAQADIPQWVLQQTNAKSVAYYMNSDADIYNRMLNSGTSYILPMRAVDLPNISDPNHTVIPLVFSNPAFINNALATKIFAGALQVPSGPCAALLQDFITNTDATNAAALWSAFKIPYETTGDPAANVQRMANYINGNVSIAGQVGTQMNTILKSMIPNSKYTAEVPRFMISIVADNNIFPNARLNDGSNPFFGGVQAGINTYGSKSGVVSFFDNWSQGQSWLTTNTTPGQLLNVVYNGNPATVTNSFVNTAPDASLASVIANIPSLTIAQYTTLIASKLGGVTIPAVSLSSAVDSLSLAEHHIYGSSRLGIQAYDTSLYRNVYVSGTPANSVFPMSRKQQWYSYAYGDLVDSSYKDPWGHGDVTQWQVSRKVGKRYYELTDHLGNVLATIMDRKTGHVNSSIPTLYDYYNPDIASASDYYPGGMLMPGRNVNADRYRMGAQGQFKDDEVYGSGNEYAFKYRMEDARLNRFWSVDPLTKKYPYNSSYAFSENRLTDGIELEGLEYAGLGIGMMYANTGKTELQIATEITHTFKTPTAIAVTILTVGAAAEAYAAAGGIWGIFNTLMFNSTAQNLVIGGLAGLAGYEGPDIPAVGEIVEAKTMTWAERKFVSSGGKAFGPIVKSATLIMEEGSSFTNKMEKRVVQKLLSEGNAVVVKAEISSGVMGVASGSNGDLLVNGIKTEIKGISEVGNTSDAISKAIKDRLSKASGQAKTVILDLVDQEGASEEVAVRGVSRYFGQSTGGMKEVRIMGKGYDKVIKNSKYKGE